MNSTRTLCRPPPGHLATGGPAAKRSRPLVGTFEENILNGRLESVCTVEGYVADVRASSRRRQASPWRAAVRVNFYSLGGSFPYLGQVSLGQRGYKIPKSGTLQVSLFNPNGTLVKLFLLHYDLADMPASSQTFLRQKTLLMPVPLLSNKPAASTTASSCRMSSQMETRDRNVLCTTAASNNNSQPPPGSVTSAAPSIKYLIQLNIISSKSGRIYLNKDLRIFVSKKMDLETASQFSRQHYELRAIDEMPQNPKYFSR